MKALSNESQEAWSGCILRHQDPVNKRRIQDDNERKCQTRQRLAAALKGASFHAKSEKTRQGLIEYKPLQLASGSPSLSLNLGWTSGSFMRLLKIKSEILIVAIKRCLLVHLHLPTAMSQATRPSSIRLEIKYMYIEIVGSYYYSA